MPYQNLDSEIMLALSIWLLAISIFVIMMILAILEIMTENQDKTQVRSKTSSSRWDRFRHLAVNLFQRKR